MPQLITFLAEHGKKHSLDNAINIQAFQTMLFFVVPRCPPFLADRPPLVSYPCIRLYLLREKPGRMGRKKNEKLGVQSTPPFND